MVDIDVFQTVTSVSFEVEPNTNVININKVTIEGTGGGATNLSPSQTATNFTINSDTGTDATIPLGNGTLAGATLNDYTTAEKNKLAGIALGAEVNVNADWDATSGDAQILNKPTIPAASPITIVNGTSLFSTGLVGTGTGSNATNSNFFGYSAGVEATEANNSNFFGYSAGVEATNASRSNFFGIEAGEGATNASQSNFFGDQAGRQATDAYNSNFLGQNAGDKAINAGESNFLGGSAGQNATNANGSNFIGTSAGRDATNANHSNFIGISAGQEAMDANYSNLFGYNVGSSFTDNNIGANNIIIGTNISLPDAAINSINLGGVLFGTGTYLETSNEPSITPTSGGRIGIGVVEPTNKLHIYSEAANTSGLRLERLTSSSPTSTGQAIGVDASGNIVTVTGGGGGVTNLITTQTDTNFTINSDTGDDAIVPLANGLLAGATINDYTTPEKTKLAGIATGAEVNVNADWNATSGDSQILNKPTIPSTTNFVPYTGATANVDLGTHSITVKDLIVNHSSGSGDAATITKGGSGEALKVVKTSGSGNAASITGGVTLLDELHLNTDLADTYIASAAIWNAKQDALGYTPANDASVVHLTGNETIAGTKTFSSNIVIPATGSALILSASSGGTVSGLSTTTYPDLTELSYVKGVTSAIQTQLNGKITNPTALKFNGDLLQWDATTSEWKSNGVIINDTDFASTSNVYCSTLVDTLLASKQDTLTLTTTGTSGAATLIGSTLNIPQYSGGGSSSQGAFTVLANNTNASAVPTEQGFRNEPSKAYAGATPTWTGTTAPSGTTNHTYSFSRVGNLVTLRVSLDYTTAGSAVSQVTFDLPSDCPTPELPSGVSNNLDVISYGSSMLSGNRNVPAAPTTTYSAIRIKSTGVYEINIGRNTAAAHRYAYVTIQYFTT